MCSWARYRQGQTGEPCLHSRICREKLARIAEPERPSPAVQFRPVLPRWQQWLICWCCRCASQSRMSNESNFPHHWTHTLKKMKLSTKNVFHNFQSAPAHQTICPFTATATEKPGTARCSWNNQKAQVKTNFLLLFVTYFENSGKDMSGFASPFKIISITNTFDRACR